MKFNIDDYKGKYVMHCKTEKEAIEFLDYMKQIGRPLGYSARCCCGEDVSYFNKGTWGHIKYAICDGYTILEWSDFINGKFTKADLRTGDVVMRRNGKIGIINRTLDTIISKDGYSDLNTIKSDLTTVSEEWDIIAVRRPLKQRDCQFSAFACEWGTLVYERKEPEEMTLAEVCRLLGKEIKIVK